MMFTKTTQRVPFRLLHMECCGTLICWVNPRFPNYCPECAARAYPMVRGYVTASDEHATLITRIEGLDRVISHNTFTPSTI